MDNNPILKLLFRNVESTQMIRAKSSSKDKLQLQTNEHNNRNTIPIVKSAGNKCTTFNDSGYFLYRLIRAIPELLIPQKDNLPSASPQNQKLKLS